MKKKVGLYNENGLVVNVVKIDTETEYTPPEGLSIIDNELSNIGDSVENDVLIPYVPPSED